MIAFLKACRKKVLISLTHNLALPMLKNVRRPVPFQYSELELCMLPAGTLGNDLFNFLEQRNLPLLRHYARHDIKHVLLGYDTSEEGEVCLQSFMLGTGRISFPVLATVIYGFATMPEYWRAMKAAYHNGKKATPFHHWNWNEMVKEETVALRNKIYKLA